jgi:hypothetical protein
MTINYYTSIFVTFKAKKKPKRPTDSFGTKSKPREIMPKLVPKLVPSLEKALRNAAKSLKSLVGPAGFEPATN